ncbi:Rz1-like lysis system protein LysC [Taklimakanibacter albus]|uniref:Rz1-like lysis system protein LysC n=1 Tax=Taklimakanibacter albus TaxID=2800327 RepID=UPI003B96974F
MLMPKLGLTLLCLTLCAACSARKEGTGSETVFLYPAEQAPCDTSERDPPLNEDLANELTRTRLQRNTCAAKVEANNEFTRWAQEEERRRKEKKP